LPVGAADITVVSLNGDGKTEQVIFADYDANHNGVFITNQARRNSFAPASAKSSTIVKNSSTAGNNFTDGRQGNVAFGEGDVQAQQFSRFILIRMITGDISCAVQINGDASSAFHGLCRGCKARS